MTTSRPPSPAGLSRLGDFASEFDGWLEVVLAVHDNPAQRLGEAMRYAVLGPGKRIRPYLVVRCCQLSGGRTADARPAALAIEFVHAFSLVHDDLPAMDNDDLRRGRPTTHRQFDEATAVLAGDALLSEAFALLAESPLPAQTVVALIRELAVATGPAGMIGGQSLDMLGESLAPDEAMVRRIHALKTARLFEASARMGGLCAGAPDEMLDHLGRFGRGFGLLFQATDDLLDVLSSSDDVGKRTGKDAGRRKQTFPACIGIEASRSEVSRLAREAVASLRRFSADADDLHELIVAISERCK